MGYIDLTEFIVAGMKMQGKMTQDHFQKAFEYFDIDHSGNITYEEIAFFLEDEENSVQALKAIFKQIDENNDGSISKAEFVKLLMRETKINQETEKKK